MLSDISSFRNYLNTFASGDTDENPYDKVLIQAADSIFKSLVKRDLETQNYTLCYSGQDEVDLALRQRPVLAPVFSGTLTSGSASFTTMALLPQFQYPTATNGTQLSGTQNLLAGMPAAVVASTGTTATLAALPVNTTIASISSSTQVVLSNAATKSGSYNLVFGLDVYLDLQGWYGDASGAFGATTQLLLGSNYVLKRDKPDGSSKRGLLQRLTGGPLGAGWWGLGDRLQGGSPVSSLTAAPLPRWTSGMGNIKVAWTAGVGVGATPPDGALPTLCLIPPELTAAVNIIAVWLRSSTQRGAPLDSSQQADALRQQMESEAKKVPSFATLSDTVRRWREFSL